jgi:hypothetical protein
MMKVSLALAAIALTAGLASAEQPTPQSDPTFGLPTQTTVGKDLSKDHPATIKDYGTAAGAAAAGRERRAERGTGVATGFVAAGLGLAVLGLFVRKRSHHDPHDHSDDDDDSRSGGSSEI